MTADVSRRKATQGGRIVVERIDIAIIGAGQAGLALSYWLRQQGREHLLIEAASRVGEVWRTQRWDSFTLVTPNWSLQLPGMPYDGNDPHGFLPRDEIVAYLERYAAFVAPEIRFDTRVTAVATNPSGHGFRVETTRGPLGADNVVVASGSFQAPRRLHGGERLTTELVQLDSSQYRNPEALPPGAVLVVGSAQSGCQIAEELYQSGRKVYLAIGSAGRAPRRYRGRDIFWWLITIGFFDQTVESLPSPRVRFAGNPHLSGKNGGRTLNLHRFARDGVTLLGHLDAIDGQTLHVAPDLRDCLERADRFAADLTKAIDAHIARTGMDAPPDDGEPELRDGFAGEPIRELDLQASGISAVIWATGYRHDFSWLKLPSLLDGDGYPVQRRGVSPLPGLFFVGLHWLHTRKSGLFAGVGEDAAYVAEAITARRDS
jgi:putative flavoprotein involved in K+ transport